MNDRFQVELVDIEFPFDAKLASSVAGIELASSHACYPETEEMHAEICLSYL